MGRECGTCTKCCDGWLTATIRGHDMFPGKPCFFVEQGIGCKDYENRPEDPCKTYSCFWLKNEEMPDHFKPELSGVILNFNTAEGIPYLVMNPAPEKPSPELLSWTFIHVINNDYNFKWRLNKEYQWNWIGSTEFCAAMERESENA
jgi:hypothetical protein